MIHLRPYQQAALDGLTSAFRAGRRAPLLVLPTGGGKTVAFCYMARGAAAKGNRVYILVHREELVQQVSDTLKAFNVGHTFIAAGRYYDPRRMVQVCSVMSLARRLGRVPAPDLIIADEAHHAVAGSWRKVAAAYPQARVVGVTATPQRLDGRGLGDVFDHMVVGPSVSELTELGALCRYRLFAPVGIDTRGLHTVAGDFNRQELARVADRPSVTGNAVDHYRRLAPGRRAVAFCAGVAHAKNVAEEFQRAGFEAGTLHGGMAADLRADLVNKFRAGIVQVLTSVDVVSEGFDLPAIEVAISLRPTQSLIVWLQQVGRALRPHPGKDYALILDHAGNTERHGLPDDERDWSLEGAKRRKGPGQQAPRIPTRTCPKCFAVYQASVRTCTHVWPDGTPCGQVFAVDEAMPDQKDGELVEVDTAAVKKDFLRRRAAAQTMEQLVEFAKAEGYKQPVAWAQKWHSIRNKYVGRKAA